MQKNMSKCQLLYEDSFSEMLESSNSKLIKEVLRIPILLAVLGGDN